MMGYITLEPAVEVPPTHPPELAGMRLEDETYIVRQDDFCLGPSSIAGTPLWIASSPGLLHRLL